MGNRPYVNGQLVSEEGLRAKLKEELSHCMVWTVYLEAANDALNMDALYAMDAIERMEGNVVWITPKTREEFEKAGLVARRNSKNYGTQEGHELSSACVRSHTDLAWPTCCPDLSTAARERRRLPVGRTHSGQSPVCPEWA